MTKNLIFTNTPSNWDYHVNRLFRWSQCHCLGKSAFLWVNIYTLLFTNADLPQNPVIGSAIKKKSMWVLHDQNDCQLFDLEYAQVWQCTESGTTLLAFKLYEFLKEGTQKSGKSITCLYVCHTMFTIFAHSLKCRLIFLCFYNQVVRIYNVTFNIQVLECLMCKDSIESMMSSNKSLQCSLQHNSPSTEICETLHDFIIQSFHWFSPCRWKGPDKWHYFFWKRENHVKT